MSALNGNQVYKLQKLVLKHFSDALEQVVFYKLDKPLSHFATGPDLEKVVFRLLIKLDRDQVRLLIEGLKEHTESSEAHASLDEALGQGGAQNTDPSELWESLLISENPPIPFINRRTWRKMLEDAADTQKDYRALSITGSGPCGKSFSWHLLEKVADGFGFRTHMIDLKQAEWTLKGACEEINAFLKLSLVDMQQFTFSDSPTMVRVAQKFATWVSLHNDQLKTSHWLVFDGLSETATAQTEVQRLLVPALLKKAEENKLRNLKIFLLGARADTVGNLHLWTRHEEVSSLKRNDIENFLIQYAKKKNQRLKPKELDELVDMITGGATFPFDLATMRRITSKTRMVIEEVII